MVNEKVYAVYKGDELQFHGTIEDIAETLCISKRTVKRYSQPSYVKSVEGKNRIKLIEVNFW